MHIHRMKLTRGKWDPYPWVSSVEDGSAACLAGIKPGDCLLEVNSEDIIGHKVSEVAEIVKSKPGQVSLLLWNAGVDPLCSPEALCCGPMPNNLQRLSACMSTILAFLECPVCLDTIPPPTYQCDNGHVICIRCRAKSERCPVCRLRFNRGRSLLSDQVYNALVDAFNLKEESDETRMVKMHQIFKVRNKNKNIPDIRVTQSHTNKFLARIGGKSTSVDNLSSNSRFLSPSNASSTEHIFNAQLKTKSLSSNEIFQTDSPNISRTGSVVRLSRIEMVHSTNNSNENRPASYHGSFEFLDRKFDDVTPIHNSLTCLKSKYLTEDGNLFHCPFTANCTALIKGTCIMEHFQVNHDGPLVQFFHPQVAIYLKKILEEKELCYVIYNDGNVFFLRINSDFSKDENLLSIKDILVWVWYLGSKKAAKEFEVKLELHNKDLDKILLSVRSSVFSLSGVSSQEINEHKKGIFLNAETLEVLGSSSQNLSINIEILKVE